MAYFVAHLPETNDCQSRAELASAIDWANGQFEKGDATLANIYKVAVIADPSNVIASLHEPGNAELVRTFSKKASESEIQKYKEDTFEVARKAGTRALLKHLDLIPRDAPDPPEEKPLRRI